MNVLKTSPFLRPSTPSSPSLPPQSTSPPRPESNHGVGTFRPTKLSLGNFMRQPSLPTMAPPPAPVPQDASYLEMLGLKLSEAVTKALAQPLGPPTANDLVSAKKPIAPGRGLALGTVIAAELNAVHDNSHLYRAVLRSLQKPLSVLLTNLSNLLLPLVAAQAFLAVPTISNQFLFPNPVQAHALAVSKFCEELLNVFDEMALGLDVDSRGDGLKPVRDGLASLIKRVINPLIGAIRGELIPLVEALETPNTTLPVKPALGNNKIHVVYHPSIVALQTLMPSYGKVLTACTTSSVSQASLASLLISILWKALVALSHRNNIKLSAPTLPELSSMKKRQGSTPPLTPPPARFGIKLPPSRPASPPAVSIHATPAQDCKALYDVLFGLPRPVDGQAREAVDEAFEGLRTLPDLLRAMKAPPDIEISDPLDTARQLNELTTEIPFLVALHVILCALGDPDMSSASSILGISGEDYRKGCLSGFSRAEECAETIGQRVLDFFRSVPTSSQAVIYWLESELEEMIDA